MTFQWMSQGTPCPIVEFQDVRTEKFRSGKYLALVEDRLTLPFTLSGAQPLGSFAVENHPDRLIFLRGFSSMTARREALTAFHAGADWAVHRRSANDLVRDEKVMLTRAVRPEDGVRATKLRTPLTLMISELRYAEQIGDYHLWLRLFLRKDGLDPVASFATLEHVNDVPAVPVLRNRSHHVALLPSGRRPPQLPPELRAMLRFAPEVLALEPAPALVW